MKGIRRGIQDPGVSSMEHNFVPQLRPAIAEICVQEHEHSYVRVGIEADPHSVQKRGTRLGVFIQWAWRNGYWSFSSTLFASCMPPSGKESHWLSITSMSSRPESPLCKAHGIAHETGQQGRSSKRQAPVFAHARFPRRESHGPPNRVHILSAPMQAEGRYGIEKAGQCLSSSRQEVWAFFSSYVEILKLIYLAESPFLPPPNCGRCLAPPCSYLHASREHFLYVAD